MLNKQWNENQGLKIHAPCASFCGMKRLRRFILIILVLCHSSCGYHFSSVKDSLPGGIKSISIATFQNETHEAGLETVFTSALRNEFYKSKAVKVVSSQAGYTSAPAFTRAFTALVGVSPRQWLKDAAPA